MSLRVQVCGDPTVDWMGISNVHEPGRGQYFWEPELTLGQVDLSVQPGGSALITQVLRAFLPEGTGLHGVDLDPELLEHAVGAPISRSWTMWRAFGQKDKKSLAYRIAVWGSTESGLFDYAKAKLTGACDLLVLEDTNLGFRDHEDGWPEALAPGQASQPEVLLKLAIFNQTDKLPILKRLRETGLAERTTVLTAVGDLRACPVTVGVSLSWERLLEEIVAAVRSKACPFVDEKGELAFARVIVTIGAAGAVIVDRDHSTLVFDRTAQEGDFESSLDGSMMGYNTCVLAALATAWAEGQGKPDWAKAVEYGLGLARLLHFGGYAVIPRVGYEDAPAPKPQRLQFPCDELVKAYRQRREEGAKGKPGEKPVWDLGTFVDANNRATDPEVLGRWTILAEAVRSGDCPYPATPGTQQCEAVLGCARGIACKGPAKSLPDVPLSVIGDWRSADRHEIEGVRSVQNALRAYLDAKRFDTPLAVAVFGPPGAGKSFAIKQIALGLGLDKEALLTFNLSQFESPEELAAAFHQIRDLQLKGKTPVVFWDEFDCPCQKVALGWLRYFLAPIQDGVFVDRGVPHPTGGGIYVFAGGTRHRFADFTGIDQPGDVEAKKPDFISRLRAYIDVKGPNGDPNIVEDDLYVVRRAFLLNSFLQRLAPQLDHGQGFRVGEGVLNALLRTTFYQHGARSMGNLVMNSDLRGRGRFEPSSLPPEHLLAMHVDAGEFLQLVQLADREMLRVGITGHIGLDPALMPALVDGLKLAVRIIEEHYPNRMLTVFSPMAVGAARLVARELLSREGSRLIAVLPVPADEYVKDFGTSEDHRDDYSGAEYAQEFRYWLAHRALATIEMTPSATRDEAYQKVGFYVAEHCDVLVAVWDGLGAQGQGGTAEVVAEARRLKRPICHVWAGNFKEKVEKRTVVEHQGQVRYMNFGDDPADDWQDAPPA